MAGVKWIKLYTHMFNTSRKIKKIEKMENGDTYIVIWIKLLLLAGDINDDGAIYITTSVPFDTDELADELRRPTPIVEAALDLFEAHDMIHIENGIIHISSWEKYQNVERLAEIREYNRQAQQRCRARRKAKAEEEKASEDVNDKSMTMSMTSQRCHDTEEDEEVDKDKDKELHSFTHSACDGESERDDTKRRYLGGSLGKGVVMLSDEQIDSLLDLLSIEEFDYYVGVIAENELRGHRYRKKTHYQAILDMANKDRKVK